MKQFKNYQHLEGEEHDDRSLTEVGSRFWNEGKFDSFVVPFLPKDPSEMTFIDVGCNKGVFLKEAEDYGFGTVIGVDSDELAVKRGRSWAEQHARNYKIYLEEMEDVLSKLPVADYTVLANTHYYFTINDWLDYIDRLQYKTRYVIIITAKKSRGNRCWARADLEGIRGYFKDWEEVGFEDGPPLEGDPHPRKLWGLCFKSPHLDRVPIDSLDIGNHVQEGFYEELDEGKDFTETRYYRILLPYRTEKHKWSLQKFHTWMRGKIKVYNDIKREGLLKTIIIDKKDKVLDGNHRIEMLSHLGHKTVIVRRV